MESYALTGRGGTTTLADFAPLQRIFVCHATCYGRASLLAVVFWGGVFPKGIFQITKLYQDGKLPVDHPTKGHINHNINEAFDKLDHGETVRQVIVFK